MLPATSTAASMEEQTPQAPASSSPSTTNQPASDPTSSSPVVTTSVAMTTSILSTSDGVAGRDVCLFVNKPLPTNTVMSMSIAPTTSGRGEGDANAGLVVGVVVCVLLAVVVAVVVAAIALTVCSVRWRRNKKYALSCNVTYDVPYDAYIGEFAKH